MLQVDLTRIHIIHFSLGFSHQRVHFVCKFIFDENIKLPLNDFILRETSRSYCIHLNNVFKVNQYLWFINLHLQRLWRLLLNMAHLAFLYSKLVIYLNSWDWSQVTDKCVTRKQSSFPSPLRRMTYGGMGLYARMLYQGPRPTHRKRPTFMAYPALVLVWSNACGSLTPLLLQAYSTTKQNSVGFVVAKNWVG